MRHELLLKDQLEQEQEQIELKRKELDAKLEGLRKQKEFKVCCYLIYTVYETVLFSGFEPGFIASASLRKPTF